MSKKDIDRESPDPWHDLLLLYAIIRNYVTHRWVTSLIIAFVVLWFPVSQAHSNRLEALCSVQSSLYILDQHGCRDAETCEIDHWFLTTSYQRDIATAYGVCEEREKYLPQRIMSGVGSIFAFLKVDQPTGEIEEETVDESETEEEASTEDETD
jgi:hypothetical protein